MLGKITLRCCGMVALKSVLDRARVLTGLRITLCTGQYGSCSSSDECRHTLGGDSCGYLSLTNSNISKGNESCYRRENISTFCSILYFCGANTLENLDSVL